MADQLELPLVLRRWEPMAGGDEISSLLQPPQWTAAEWESDLFLDRSLPNITAAFAAGRSWDDVHPAVLQSGLAKVALCGCCLRLILKVWNAPVLSRMKRFVCMNFGTRRR